ncbi:hypothetical protein [Streptomyces chumphonensis]|uniref:hypothetical protein n=1 Tax=Streptomyces chumphonensis TaxID=1214925 RepID=UPI003D75B95C
MIQVPLSESRILLSDDDRRHGQFMKSAPASRCATPEPSQKQRSNLLEDKTCGRVNEGKGLTHGRVVIVDLIGPLEQHRAILLTRVHDSVKEFPPLSPASADFTFDSGVKGGTLGMRLA